MSEGDVDDSLVAMFCDITGADETTAAHYLGASGGDLEVAVGLFMDGGPRTAAPPEADSPAAAPLTSPVEDDIRQPIRPTRGVLVDEQPGEDTSHWIDPARFTGPWNSRSQVSAPFSDLSTERGRRLAELFRPPTRIMFVGHFEAARRAAKSRNRWLIVSLHDPAEFACQVLNRDLWSDSSVQAFVLEHAVFLQLSVGTADAERYARFYPLTGHPHISLVDPRTAKAVKTWAGRNPAPSEFIGELIEFIEAHPLKAPRSPQVVSIDSDSESEAVMADSDDFITAKPDPFFGLKLPDEPPLGSEGTTTLQFRLPDGSRTRRRFLLTQPIRDVFLYIHSVLTPKDSSSVDFDVLEHTKSLRDSWDSSLQDVGLRNASLNVVLQT